MNANYQGRYVDRFGEEPITIRNDGRLLRTTIRGVRFCGEDFDALSPEDSALPEKLASFTLQQNALCCCFIECDIPVPVVTKGQITEGRLHVELDLGEPASNGGIDRETLKLSLSLAGNTFTGSGTSGWFEDELLEIQAALPDDFYIKACINCAFSDYNPAGHGLFGGLACFRDEKEAYLAVKTKADIFRVWEKLTEFVQETYLCPDFERRRPETGYRG